MAGRWEREEEDVEIVGPPGLGHRDYEIEVELDEGNLSLDSDDREIEQQASMFSWFCFRQTIDRLNLQGKGNDMKTTAEYKQSFFFRIYFIHWSLASD